ncbi:MAG: GntR family transcriptional regulator [Candidatus Limivicinus sp.]
MAKSSRSEEVFSYIKEQFLSGTWQSGDRLNDSLLAEEIGVSRISVREALFRLTETGVVEKKQWKGYFIREITDETVADIVDVRIAMESIAIRYFIRESTPETLELLKNVLDESRRLLNEGSLTEYLAMDYSFHETIFHNQHNQYIAHIMDILQLVIHFIRYKSMGTGDSFVKTAENSIHWHQIIFDAIEAKDEELAVKLLKDHLINHQDEVFSQLK